ncbi:hypothetical protein [Halodesulfovibrio sp. MK-HDV]|uniref:hypothetical protein n=1 Tax=Halodesulfovibrio sp. MK-HDV TaxID=2599925 RepID=UPI0013F97ABC|nr:hypothetical protein [Halodesulfovibrio sp. MK-HDV]KAF1076328.1 hypothetical protein MKHDV_01357 [Halodesulfovibrio sp. MK-HDV]
MARFTIPRDVYFGENTIEELKTLDGNKAVIVISGGSIKKKWCVRKNRKLP